MGSESAVSARLLGATYPLDVSSAMMRQWSKELYHSGIAQETVASKKMRSKYSVVSCPGLVETSRAAGGVVSA